MRARGFSLIEVIISLAILSVVVLIIVGIERGTLNLLRETDPAQTSLSDLDPVLARFGRDVMDAAGYWPNNRPIDGYTQSTTTLILRLPDAADDEVVVWNFGEESVERITYTGTSRGSEWSWNGRAQWRIGSFDGAWVRLQASVSDRLMVDRIWRPRAR